MPAGQLALAVPPLTQSECLHLRPLAARFLTLIFFLCCSLIVSLFSISFAHMLPSISSICLSLSKPITSPRVAVGPGRTSGNVPVSSNSFKHSCTAVAALSALAAASAATFALDVAFTARRHCVRYHAFAVSAHCSVSCRISAHALSVSDSNWSPACCAGACAGGADSTYHAGASYCGSSSASSLGMWSGRARLRARGLPATPSPSSLS